MLSFKLQSTNLKLCDVTVLVYANSVYKARPIVLAPPTSCNVRIWSISMDFTSPSMGMWTVKHWAWLPNYWTGVPSMATAGSISVQKLVLPYYSQLWLVWTYKPIGLLYTCMTFDPKSSGKRCLHVGLGLLSLGLLLSAMFASRVCLSSIQSWVC